MADAIVILRGERMRGRGGRSGEELPYWKSFPIGPVLVFYGGEDPPSGYGERPYRCPFHGDGNASATVKTVEGEEQWFNCHAGACPTGNAVQIIMKVENLEYEAALERAAEIAGTDHAPLRQPSTRSGRMAQASRNQSGRGSFRRTWRGD